ncbi:restriction endonuclease subunit S [Vibrio parahaemolyticus]|nr:restriction endonuclease subunit S [Vibrio parahaemolyticus]MDG2862759.1 restriction endonuclease subunit S [Vibrio parahaemolyticus]
MSCNWPIVKLGDYCSKIGSGATPKGGNSVYLDHGEISLIRSQNIYNEGFKSDGLVYITPEAAQKLKNVIIEPNDVLINITGDSVARVCLAPNEFLPARVNQHVAILRVDPEEFDHRYLRYFLTSTKMQNYLLTIASTGGTRNALTKSMLESLEVSKPSLDVQKRIGDVLESFESKIELNSRTNQTLEEMAQAIFKSWFVDFDPVKAKMNGEQPEGMDAATASLFPEKLVESELGLIPEGWEVNQLSDICKNHSQSYDLKSVDEVIFVNTGDVLEGDFLHKDYSPVAGLPGQAKKAIKEDDILYSEIRPKNKRFAYVDFDVSDYVVSTKFMVIQANEKVHPRLLYMILTRQNTIDEFNVIADSRSGTFPQITFKAISNLNFCIAPREVQDAFVTQVMPMIKLQRSLKTENKQLAELRDTLLPKLLSGEIELEAATEN